MGSNIIEYAFTNWFFNFWNKIVLKHEPREKNENQEPKNYRKHLKFWILTERKKRLET
jgi:hypothetical protein